MSIFDVDEKIDNVENPKDKYILHERMIKIQYSFINEASLLNEEDFKNYCTHLSKVDVFDHPLIPGLPRFSKIRNDIKVVFSDETPTYSNRYWGKPWFQEENKGSNKGSNKGKHVSNVLGRHFPNHNVHGECIYLYIENIKCACGYGSSSKIKKLLLSTYVHELYHAYFKSGNGYKPEVEEPLAEFGALFCLEALAFMGIIEMRDVDEYHSMVKRKKKSLPIYAFGGYIYDKHKQEQKCWNMGRLLESYRQKVHKTNVDSLFSCDPENWDQAYEDLCKVLNYTD